MSRTALIMAGGTGGHIFPGLAIAQALLDRGWHVHWLGGKGATGAPSLESKIVPTHNIPFEAIDFGGLRGKGWAAKVMLPWRLAKAMLQSRNIIRRIKPDVVVGLGGYVSFPAGLVCAITGRPLVLHEQNSVAGMANKYLAKVARKTYTAFPDVIEGARWIGNPLRREFLGQPEPALRLAARRGPLRMLVLGGSLGAQALNEVVPQALAAMPAEARPMVIHQSGQDHIEVLRANYDKAGVQAELKSFIDDAARAIADADLIICRAGASTVTEIAAVGAAAVFVPFPSAVDDHQTTNASYLVGDGGGWLVKQSDLTPDRLARMLIKADRPTLLAAAIAARKKAKWGATERLVAACESLAPTQGPV